MVEAGTAAYTAPDSGTPPTNSVAGAHTVLVTIYMSATQNTDDDGCAMSFTANNTATAASGVSLAAGADDHGFGTGTGSKKSFLVGGSASFVVNTIAGTTTFTGVYKALRGGSCAIAAGSSIIVQVY
jgi:hypothetical protein